MNGTDTGRKKPAYLRLYEQLRGEILSASRAYGERLPSRRELIRDQGVSAMTADHCYELLCQEGYAESRPKSGYYVAYRDDSAFRGLEAGDPVEGSREAPASPTQEGAGEETGFPFSVMARTMRRVLTEYGERIMIKTPSTGSPELRTAISRYLDRNRGIRVAPEQIVIGSGAEYLYGMVVELLGPDRVYGVEYPSYQKIEQVYRARGVRCELLPLGTDGIRSEALWKTAASVLHITPYRSFPSGVTASASRRGEYLRWVESGDRFLVEDDVESEFSLLRKREETVFAHGKRVIYLNTFTRTVAPAFRTGYMVLPEKLMERFQSRLGFYSCTVPTFEQAVLTELINGGDFERHLNRIRRRERKQRTENPDGNTGSRSNSDGKG